MEWKNIFIKKEIFTKWAYFSLKIGAFAVLIAFLLSALKAPTTDITFATINVREQLTSPLGTPTAGVGDYMLGYIQGLIPYKLGIIGTALAALLTSFFVVISGRQIYQWIPAGKLGVFKAKDTWRLLFVLLYGSALISSLYYGMSAFALWAPVLITAIVIYFVIIGLIFSYLSKRVEFFKIPE